jgi:hypothetical protein
MGKTPVALVLLPLVALLVAPVATAEEPTPVCNGDPTYEGPDGLRYCSGPRTWMMCLWNYDKTAPANICLNAVSSSACIPVIGDVCAPIPSVLGTATIPVVYAEVLCNQTFVHCFCINLDNIAHLCTIVQ